MATNYEKYFQGNDELIKKYLATNFCVRKDTNEIKPCGLIDCRDCLFFRDGNNCVERRQEWLSQTAITPPLYPIGTPVEINSDEKNAQLGYYNGVHEDDHIVTSYKRNVGVSFNDYPLGTIVKQENIKKIGE